MSFYTHIHQFLIRRFTRCGGFHIADWWCRGAPYTDTINTTRCHELIKNFVEMNTDLWSMHSCFDYSTAMLTGTVILYSRDPLNSLKPYMLAPRIFLHAYCDLYFMLFVICVTVNKEIKCKMSSRGLRLLSLRIESMSSYHHLFAGHASSSCLYWAVCMSVYF